MSTLFNSIQQYFDRDTELRVLFVFSDPDPFIRDELQDTTWPDGWRYVEFDGGWFTAKYRLDNDWADDKVVMFFNQPNPLGSKDRMLAFPLLDVLTANAVYQKQDYAAFMQQYSLPKEMTAFVMKYCQQMQGDAIMKLLKPRMSDGSINTDMAVRAFISSFMGMQRVMDWDEILLRVILMCRSCDEKKRTDFFPRLYAMTLVKDALDKHFKTVFGKTPNYNSESKVKAIVEVMKYNAITQYLAPIDADNYKALRISDTEAMQQINGMIEMAQSKDSDAKVLEEVMGELGSEIRDTELIRWYGTGANYGYMPKSLCVPVLRSLMTETLVDNPGLVLRRLETLVNRTSEGDALYLPISFASHAALFYQKAQALGSFTLNSPDEYVAYYKDTFYLIDQLYRLVTEKYYAQGISSSVLFETMQGVKMGIDHYYAKLCNRLNLEWTRCVKDADGMTAMSAYRQQDFYEIFLAQAKRKVAVIVSDALRYEVAQELIGELAKSKHNAKLLPALAMLPTETKYCKPALLPHERLRFYENVGDAPAMGVDEYVLDSLQKRSEHLGRKRDGAVAADYRDVAKYIRDDNRELFKHPLVYVFHDTIDQKSHDGTARDVVNSCREAIIELADLVHKIHETYNVIEVYVTADHGFLFNDMVFEEKDKQKVEEDAVEKKSRYYITKCGAKVDGIKKYPLSEVSGMMEDYFVGVPEGTNRLAAPAGGYMFAHGGGSLQEMVIPVIRSIQERVNSKQMVGFTLMEHNLTIQASRLRFHVLQTEPVSMDVQERYLKAALFAGDVMVTKEQDVDLTKMDALLENRLILVDLTLNKGVTQNVLQLRLYEDGNVMNPLLVENVMNKTLIQTDF